MTFIHIPRRLCKTMVILALTLATAGCSLFSPAPRDTQSTSLPETFSLFSEKDSRPYKWWESLGNQELNAFVEEALVANLDMRTAWARLRQVRAAGVQAGASQYPTLDANGGYTHTRTGSTEQKKTEITYADEHTLGLSAGYEVDLWGKVAAEATAGELDILASREELNSAAMTVAAQVTTKWLQIQAQRQKKRILEKQIRANKTYLELIELRFRNALATALDVYQQRENVAKVKAQLPPVASEEQLLLHELALLLGRPAGTVEVADAPLPDLNALPALGLPADLLANRPDIRAAGLTLRSADWSVAAARANRLPTVTLGVNGAYSGIELATLFNNWMLTLAGAITAPVLDGGYNAAAVEKARGVVDEQFATYTSTVLTAFKEVEDALANETWQQRYIAAHRAQLEAARISLNEATSRYRQGLEDYLPVLTALLAVQELEVSQVEDQTNLILYRIALHRALGGTWTNQLSASDPAQATTHNTSEHNG